MVKNANLIGEGSSPTLTIGLWVNMIPKSKDSINHEMKMKLKLERNKTETKIDQHRTIYIYLPSFSHLITVPKSRQGKDSTDLNVHRNFASFRRHSYINEALEILA